MWTQDVRFALRHCDPVGAMPSWPCLLGAGYRRKYALFTVVESVLLRPLPYAHADLLTYVRARRRRAGFLQHFMAQLS